MSVETAFTTFPVLTTERLRLREIGPDDAEALFAILSDEEAMQFYGHEAHRSVEDTLRLIAQIRERYARRAGIRWGITRKDDDHLIGSCSLHRFDPGYHRAETGYELHRAYWGQGIMAEAMAAILTYGFTKLALHRVEAVIDNANTRSKSLLLKLGFSYEGCLRARYVFRDRFEDEYYYGLLDREWRQRAQETASRP